MKDHISKSSSQECTLFKRTIPCKKLTIFTGKGGVGKTVLSLAYYFALKEKNKNVLYISFDPTCDQELINQLGVNHHVININSCVQTYITRKLGSSKIASWIMGTSFFKAIFNVVPLISNMMFVGEIMDLAKQNEDLYLVLDSPSSGHVLTLIESPFIFKSIVKTGVLANDIEELQSFITNPKQIEVFISSIPSHMSLIEASELKKQIQDITQIIPLIIANNLLSLIPFSKTTALPDFLERKIALEKIVINEHEDKIDYKIAHHPKTNLVHVINEITKALV